MSRFPNSQELHMQAGERAMATEEVARKIFDQPYPSYVFHRIIKERLFQDRKYGRITEEGGHDLTGWLIVIQKEVSEAMEAATGHGKRNRTGRNTVRAELIQIAACCVAALEQHGCDPEEPDATNPL